VITGASTTVRLARWLAALCAVLACGAAHAQAESDPAQELARLRAQISALGAEVYTLKSKLADQAALAAELEALSERVRKAEAALGSVDPQAPGSPDKLAELEETLEEIQGDMVTASDLRRYQLKPDDKLYRSRATQEIELRVAMNAYRQDEITRRSDAIDGLVLDEELRDQVEAFGEVAGLFLGNDQDIRPRVAFRAYWEANRFLDGGDLLFVYAMPEIMVFAQRHDIDRWQLDRDYTEPRDRVALRLKKAAAGAQVGNVRLVGGVLQLTYGAGFFLNPTNPFTPKHLLDPRREVDGVPAAQLEWTIVASEDVTLSTQVTGVATPLRNDVSGDSWHEMAWGGFWRLKLDTALLSISGIAIYQQPDALGQDVASFGGTISTAPFGITTSVEAIFREDIEGVYRPELIASLQGFWSEIGANGTTWVAEYYYNGHGLDSEEHLIAELIDAVERGRTLYAADLLTRALSRSHYLNLYLEPSLSTELTFNVAALIGLEEGGGVLARFGLDWEISSFIVHTYGGFTYGAEDSELRHHVLESFFELALTANF
jgi:hypothetical protein